VAQERSKGLLVGSLVLPVGEVANVPVLKACGPMSIAFQNSIIQANGEEDIFAPCNLLMKSSIDFSFDPGTIDGVARENK